MSKPKKPVDCVCGGSAEYCSLVAPFGGSGIAVTCPACRLRGAAAPSEERARWEWSKMQRALKHFDAVVNALDEMVRDCIGMRNEDSCESCVALADCEPAKVLVDARP